MKIRHYLCAALALLAVASCKQPEPEIVSSVTVGTKSITVSYEGELKTVALSANCEWTAAPSVGWLSVTPASGNGATALSITAAENTGDARDGKVVISSKDGKAEAEVLVTQAAKPVDPGPDPGPDPEPQGNVIKNAGQLAQFMADAPAMTADDEWSIEADIDCGGAKIAPIPSFSANLDGKNHKIYNFSVESSEATAGLFLLVNGTIKNIILGSKDGKNWDGSSSVSFDNSVEKTSHIGGLCAELAGTLENVKTFMKVNVALNNDKAMAVGGIVGSISSPATVRECENAGQIEQTVVAMSDGAWVGGVVGHANNGDALIEKCVNSADLEFGSPHAKYIMYGGIVGCSHKGATVDGCQNLGAVKFNQSVTESGGNYIMIAGVAGALYTGSIVRNSVNKGEVSSNQLQVSRIGGIVGTLNSTGIIEGNTNDGKVTLKQAAPNDNWQAAGGICGFQEKESSGNIIRKNTNNADVVVEVENATAHNNKVTAGGIIGFGVLGLEISENVNKGAVSVVNKAAGAAYAGGIVGWFKGAGTATSGNENSGAVSCKTSDDAASMAGGVVGNSSDATNTCTSDKNTGAVTCANTGYAGSIAGTNAGTLTNCIAGGSVNGTALNDSNLATLTQGASSSGKANGTTLAK